MKSLNHHDHELARIKNDNSPDHTISFTAESTVPEEENRPPFPVITASSLSSKWTTVVNRSRQPLIFAMQCIAGYSARNPYSVIAIIVVISVALVVTGMLTGFHIVTDENVLWTPPWSNPVKHSHWIEQKSGFPKDSRKFFLFFHDKGRNVLGYNQLQRVFQVVDAVRGVDTYPSVCSQSWACNFSGVTNFWNDSSIVFSNQISNDEQVIQAMSALQFSDGEQVPVNNLFGWPRRDDNGTLVFAQSMWVVIDLPGEPESQVQDFEKQALDAVLVLKAKWVATPTSTLYVDVLAQRSFSDEFTRAIIDDIPLVPLVFVIMSLYTCLVFSKRHKVQSQSLLGLAAVVSVLLSLATGYGLMFVCHIPLTSVTQLLPFVIFGIGLDDVFVLTGSWSRLENIIDPVERTYAMIDDVGLSVFLTTLTSVIAFSTGCISSVPGVFWLCLYAFPTIALVLLYQLTFFVACMVLDDKRIKANRRDCCVCIIAVPRHQPTDADTNKNPRIEATHTESISARIMQHYAEFILRPWIKVLVLLLFIGLFVWFTFLTTKMRQKFNFTDVVPTDSYIIDFVNNANSYSQRSGVTPGVYFRFVDQSNEAIQAQMNHFVHDLTNMEVVYFPPTSFWLRDFQSFVANHTQLAALPFNEQVDTFLSHPLYKYLYNSDIVRDNNGTITASRLFIRFDNIDFESVRDQMNALHLQQDVTASEPINIGQRDYPFFTFSKNYFIWEFYDYTVKGLIQTSCTSIGAVALATLVFVPHWSAVLYVLPMICILYIDLLGFLELFSVSINAVSYVILVMSIGLMIDYVLHVLLRYYETPGTRRQRSVELLKTMGASIMNGAVTTFLGTMPLAFSSSKVLKTTFIAFIGLVVLGTVHGLILMPVILSTVGTEDPPCIHPDTVELKAKELDSDIRSSDDPLSRWGPGRVLTPNCDIVDGEIELKAPTWSSDGSTRR